MQRRHVRSDFEKMHCNPILGRRPWAGRNILLPPQSRRQLEQQCRELCRRLPEQQQPGQPQQQHRLPSGPQLRKAPLAGSPIPNRSPSRSAEKRAKPKQSASPASRLDVANSKAGGVVGCGLPLNRPQNAIWQSEESGCFRLNSETRQSGWYWFRLCCFQCPSSGRFW